MQPFLHFQQILYKMLISQNIFLILIQYGTNSTHLVKSIFQCNWFTTFSTFEYNTQKILNPPIITHYYNRQKEKGMKQIKYQDSIFWFHSGMLSVGLSGF